MKKIGVVEGYYGKSSNFDEKNELPGRSCEDPVLCTA